MGQNLIKPLGRAIVLGAVATGLVGAYLIPEISMVSKAGEFTTSASDDKGRTSASAQSSVSISGSSSSTSSNGRCSARSSASAVARGQEGFDTDYDEKHVRSEDGSCSASARARASAGNRPKSEGVEKTEGGAEERK